MNPLPTGYVLPLTDHPIVREAASEMAREAHEALVESARSYGAGCVSWDRSEDRPYAVDAHARLLCSLDRPASRDWLVRFLLDRDRAELSADYPDEPTIVRDAMEAMTIRRGQIRDNPEALATAILNLLSPVTP